MKTGVEWLMNAVSVTKVVMTTVYVVDIDTFVAFGSSTLAFQPYGGMTASASVARARKAMMIIATSMLTKVGVVSVWKVS